MRERNKSKHVPTSTLVELIKGSWLLHSKFVYSFDRTELVASTWRLDHSSESHGKASSSKKLVNNRLAAVRHCQRVLAQKVHLGLVGALTSEARETLAHGDKLQSLGYHSGSFVRDRLDLYTCNSSLRLHMSDI